MFQYEAEARSRRECMCNSSTTTSDVTADQWKKQFSSNKIPHNYTTSKCTRYSIAIFLLIFVGIFVILYNICTTHEKIKMFYPTNFIENSVTNL